MRVAGEVETVLVATAWGSVGLGAVYEGGWEVEFAPWDSPPDGDEVQVTHWRQLPAPPA